jgi:hypothetical protein
MRLPSVSSPLLTTQGILTIVCFLFVRTPSGAFAQVVAGRITMGNSTLAVRGGGVILIDQNGRPKMAGRSDSLGRYSIVAPAAGRYSLRVQGPEGTPSIETKSVNLTLGATVELNVALPGPITTLDTVRVNASSVLIAPPGNPSKYDAFFQRKAMGFGHFLTSDEIEKTGMNQTADIIRKVPGMMVNQDGTKVRIQSKRCDGGTIPGAGEGGLGGNARPDKKLEPMLFIDGARVRDIESIADVVPAQIAAIEIYQGASEVPAEAKGDACAAIFIWLKQ